MARPSEPVQSPSGQPRTAFDGVRAFMLTSIAGYLIAVGASVKIIIFALSSAGVAVSGVLQVLSSLGGLALATGAGVMVYKLVQVARRRLLWRVRRKLIVSYLLIGFVPAVLIVIFFVLCGWLLLTNVSSYLVRSSLAELGNRASSVAASAAVELERASDRTDATAILERHRASNRQRLPGLSLAVVPIDPKRCAGQNGGRSALSAVLRASPVTVGEWAVGEPPEQLPLWIGCDGFAGALAYEVGDATAVDREATLVVRAVAMSPRSAGYAVVADLPVSETVKTRIEEATSIAIGRASLIAPAATPLKGQARPVAARAAGPGEPTPIPSVALLDVYDWPSGRAEALPLQIGMSVQGIYHRLSVTQASIGKRTFEDLLIYWLLGVTALFLIIEVGAAATGMALARSITGSVHELFAGTERVRQGDFGHRIAVRADDQLGELADSFNLMTASIEDLLRQSAEKKRLDEEMRLARESQMSLLPRGPLEIPGMRVAAVCVPAREVGGDYYDVLPLPDGRVGMLIADVSGKGMSAALYMAELKGLILSLSQIHQSPRDLLIAANRLISEHLDSRSFITMTYAVIDPAARTMTYARAGHTPLLYLPGSPASGRRVKILVPDGMVLGLRLDNGERFSALLYEATLSLGPGDRLAFFTDGISEAMDDQSECFGEPRLGQLIEEHAHLSVEELRERILREIDAFVGGIPQHDDMTLILLEVDGGQRDESNHG
ncbi:MAG: SpoIIE family protein phosphatase [Acidobacteria bacterium]|nr:SpoIIE family protein phosphatase [Acidobacteriota bacterium]